jgi:hypothetical protein
VASDLPEQRRQRIALPVVHLPPTVSEGDSVQRPIHIGTIGGRTMKLKLLPDFTTAKDIHRMRVGSIVLFTFVPLLDWLFFDQLNRLTYWLWGGVVGLNAGFLLIEGWRRRYPVAYRAQIQVRLNGSLLVDEPILVNRDGIIGMQFVMEPGEAAEGFVEFRAKRPSVN